MSVTRNTNKTFFKKSLATGVVTLALLSTTSVSHAACVRSGSVSVGGNEGFTYDCTGDLSAGGGSREALFFRDGNKALGQNSTIVVRNLTHNINPSSGVPGLLGLTFASGNAGTSGFEVYLTPSTGGAGSQINTSGNFAHGIVASSNGNGGLNPNDLLVFNIVNGGYASGITVETLTAANGNPFLIRTNGGTAHGIFAQSLGGSGRAGENSGDNGLDAGAGGAIFVENTATIQTFSPLSQGILVESRGGNGGPGSDGAFYSSAGNGGRGGFSREVEVENYGDIYTRAFGSNAIVARSLGGLGGDGGDGVLYTSGGGGGSTSNGFQVDVDNNGSLVTDGVRSSGILAQSIGGFGGSGGDAASFIGFAGGGRRAGNGGVVNVSNLETGSILTNGNSSAGIIAQSIGGGGGNGGNAGGLLAVGGGGSAGGAGNTVTVENLGRIQTRGVSSHGILAQSIGGGGGNGGNAGGLVAIGGSGSSTSNGGLVNVENNGLIIVENSDSSGIVAQSIGGGGGNGGSTASAFLGIGGSGGGGGDALSVTVDNNGSIVSLGARNSTAILAQSIGGGGGNGGNAVGASAGFSLNVGGRGAAGGRGDSVIIEDDENAAVNSKTLLTVGEYSHGIHAQSIGGGGGNGGLASSFAAGPGAAFAAAFGGSGGGGGSSGFLRINNRNLISTSGNNSSAILAQSIGGGGGNGGFAISASGSNGFSGSASFGGSGGNGGTGGGLILTNLGSLTTRGTNSSVLVAQSIGGGGGHGGFSVSGAAAGTGALTASVGGSGGSGGFATNTVINNSGDILSKGAESHGILAQTIGGGGGNGGFAVGGSFAGAYSLSATLGGSGGTGGSSLNSSVTNSGAVTTENVRSSGILSQSIGGGGGNGGFSISAAGSGTAAGSLAIGGSGGVAGNSGLATIVNSGVVNTMGGNAHGIHAQSIGGGGGNGGFAVAGSASSKFAGAFGLGGKGTGGGSSNTAFIDNNNADVNTSGDYSTGLLAQSIGGGGGNGGFSASAGFANGNAVGVSIGGSGGGGGSSKQALIDSIGNVTTQGLFSHGLHAQSIGGGGGNGGFSLGFSGARGHSGALILGGSGGSGNNYAAKASAKNIGDVTTSGDGAIGLIAQSIGGGGGNGGFALAGTLATQNAISGSIGGVSGGGGASSLAEVVNVGDITTTGDNAYAVLAQSIGGGGGNGGYAFSGSTSVNSNSIGFALGGTGTVGGDSGTILQDGSGYIANINAPTLAALANVSGTLLTTGLSSHAIVAQSIGGGGGNAGFSGTLTGTLKNGSNIGINLGGSGGNGGFSNNVMTVTEGAIFTQGYGANAILAQSIGGGGGNAGHGYNAALSTGSGGTTGSVVLGGTGGSGGYSRAVTVNNSADIQTEARFSNGILAQSIGGGGGNGGTTITGNLLPRSTGKQLSLTMGGNGGNGGSSGALNITSDQSITTLESDSVGILAQSIGGGGGNGGTSVGVGLTGPDSSSYSISLGGNGGSGNFANDINVNISDAITTFGHRSYGILAQSIGGGGGNGGISGAISLGRGNGNSGYTSSIGGNGGVGGYSGNVSVTTAGNVITQGNNAHAVFAQSIGGGGGNGNSSFAATRTGDANDRSRNVAVSVAIGGVGGSGNNAGNVTLNNSSLIQTSGDGAYGLYAQAIGGGGGSGGNSNAFTVVSENENENDDGTQTKSRTLSVGGSGGATGEGGEIAITNTGSVVTLGADSHGILAQSIGGGGGNGGDAAHAKPSVVDIVELPSFPSLPTIPGFDFNFNPDVPSVGDSEPDLTIDTNNLIVTVGGSGGASGNGKSIIVDNQSFISTFGDGSFGILAQSIGGGGGLGGLSESGDTGSIGVGGAGGASGNGGNINIINVGNVLTRGAGAHGIFAQSIGGGGGLAGNVDRGITDDNTTGLALGRSGGAGGNGGNVTVDSSGSITTHGNGAYGIFAQSIGGGGGVAGSIGTGPGFAGSTGAVGSAGLIDIDHTGDITTFGENAHGIYAQSVDGAGFESGSIDINYVGSITVNGDGAHAIAANAKEACSGNCNINITTASDNFIVGSIDGSAISLNDGQNNNVTNNSVLRSLAGLIGRAITGTSGNENIVNNNLIVGNIDLGTGLNAVTNTVGSTVISSSLINLGGNNATQRLTNNGDLNVGDTGNVLTTALTGNLTQSSTSRLFVDLDNNNFVTDKIDISGSADLDGELVINTLNNGSIVSGTRFSNIIQTQNGIGTSNLALNFKPTAIADYDLVSLNSGKDLALQSVVSFTPEAGTGTPNQAAIGDYFNAILSSANAAFSDAIAAMASFGSDEELAEFLGQLTPEPQGSTTSTNVLSSAVFNQRLRSCHQRTGVNKFVREGECSWYAVGMRKANRDTTSESIGYESRSFDIAGGLQYELEDGWYLGGGLSLETGSSQSSGVVASQDKNGGQLGVIVKREMGNTLLTGTLAGGLSYHDANRQIVVGADTFNAESDFETGFISLELDAAHTFDQGNWYYRPVVGTNLSHLMSSSFEESGAGALNVVGDSSSETALNVRIGGDMGYEFKIGEECGNECTLLRPYARLGYVHYLTDENSSFEARLQGDAGNSSFSVNSPTFEDFVDLNLGVELLETDNTVFRVDYGAQFGKDFEQHNVLMKVSVPF